MNFYYKILSFFTLVISCFFVFNHLNAESFCSDRYGCNETLFSNPSEIYERDVGYCHPYVESLKDGNPIREGYEKYCKDFLELVGVRKSPELEVDLDWSEGYTTIEEEERKREERKKEESELKEIEEQKRIVKLDKSYTNDEKLKLLRFFYAKEVYKYHSPDKLGISPDLLALMAKHNALDCFGYAIDLAEKEWSYDDKITELNRLCYGSTNWQISEYQNLVDLILTRNFFYPYNKKNYAIVGKVLFNFPDTIRECEKSIINLAPSKRPNHENARYIKKFYTEENERANSINWCLQRIVEGRYKIK